MYIYAIKPLQNQSITISDAKKQMFRTLLSGLKNEDMHTYVLFFKIDFMCTGMLWFLGG